jgi:type II secretion system protein I
MKPHRTGVEGFTLLEIMIALAVVGSALFVLLNSHYAALEANSDLRNEMTYRNLLSQAMGIAEVEVLAGNQGDSGDFGEQFEGYAYDFKGQAYGEGAPGLYEITVTVTGPDKTEKEMVFYAFRGLMDEVLP